MLKKLLPLLRLMMKLMKRLFGYVIIINFFPWILYCIIICSRNYTMEVETVSLGLKGYYLITFLISRKFKKYIYVIKFSHVLHMQALFNLFHFFQSTKRTVPFLFVRGDGVILVSPPLRTAWFCKICLYLFILRRTHPSHI